VRKIKIAIKYFASIRELVGQKESILVVEEGSTIDDPLADLKNQYPKAAKIIDCSFIALNEGYVSDHAVLKDRDTLAIIPPVSGGQKGIIGCKKTKERGK
jgi:molybdopterin converting factor subunit 1